MYKSVLSTFVLLFSCMLSIAQTDDFLQSEVSYTKLDENPLDRWHIGIGAGYHAGFMRFSGLNKGLYTNRDNSNSAVFSVFAEYAFDRNRHFFIRPEVTFLGRGGTQYFNGVSDVTQGIYRLKSGYVDLRVPVMYTFLDESSLVRPYVFVAPVLGFSTGGTLSLQEYTMSGYEHYAMKLSKANMASAYFAASVGAGAKFQFKIAKKTFYVGLEAGYEYGITDTYSKKERKGDIVSVNGTRAVVAGVRKFSGVEVRASFGIPLSIFKKRKPSGYTATQVQRIYVTPSVERKPCYTLDDVLEMISRGEKVVGKTICVINSVSFETGRSLLGVESYDYLNRLAQLLIRTDLKVEVKGHTDNTGSPESNMSLSRDRALAVVRYLEEQGVPSEKLSYNWYGMTKPLTTNDTEEGRRMNSRVEFEILK
ncbi:MAG: OmpA family protein [Bacteroidales bacterium]|nr:OmpA family protein [Bacteroidales bacterium]